MPATDYSELRRMPRGCIENTPWEYMPISVLAPYGPIKEYVAQLEPLIHTDWAARDFMSPESAYFTDIEPKTTTTAPDGGLGYESAAEMEAYEKILQNARLAGYHGGPGKEGIRQLGEQSQKLLKQVKDTYEKFHEGGEIVYPCKEVGAYPAGDYYFPLSVPDDVVAQRLDFPFVQGPWRNIRQDARKTIRAKYLKAIYLLWCALYGRAQAESYTQNRLIYEDRYRKTGMGLAAGPPPSEGEPQIIPEIKTPKEDEPWEPPTTPRPEGAPPEVPVPTPGPLPTPAGMPLVAKILLGAAIATALGAGGVYMYNRLRA